MPYRKVRLPTDAQDRDRNFVRRRIDPLLEEVHEIFKVTVRSGKDWNQGCNFTVTMALLNVVSGISVALYDHPPDTRSGAKFKKSLELHFPWEEEDKYPNAILRGDAAKILYDIFRNPLTHNFGIFKSTDFRYAKLAMGALPEHELGTIERAIRRPSAWERPTVMKTDDQVKLTPKCFYWGVRAMLYRAVAARTRKDSNLRLLTGEPSTRQIERSATETFVRSEIAPMPTEAGTKLKDFVRYIGPTDTNE